MQSRFGTDGCAATPRPFSRVAWKWKKQMDAPKAPRADTCAMLLYCTMWLSLTRSQRRGLLCRSLCLLFQSCSGADWLCVPHLCCSVVLLRLHVWELIQLELTSEPQVVPPTLGLGCQRAAHVDLDRHHLVVLAGRVGIFVGLGPARRRHAVAHVAVVVCFSRWWAISW